MIPYNLLARGYLRHYITLVRREAEFGDADPDLRDLQEARVERAIGRDDRGKQSAREICSQHEVNSH
jgi:hypothetical protein